MGFHVNPNNKRFAEITNSRIYKDVIQQDYLKNRISHPMRISKNMAMSGSLTDRTEPQSRRGVGEARFGAKSLMQDKASCLSKWLCDPKRAYAAHIRRLDMAE